MAQNAQVQFYKAQTKEQVENYGSKIDGALYFVLNTELPALAYCFDEEYFWIEQHPSWDGTYKENDSRPI